MRDKIVKLFCAVIVAIIAYFIFKDILMPIGNNILKGLSQNLDVQNEVSNKDFASLKYKSKTVINEENKEMLDNVMISINNDLIANNKFDNVYKDISDFYELQPYFLEYKLYLATKYKVKDIMEEMQIILPKISKLDGSEIQTYYNNNKDYCDEKFGIETLQEWQDFVTCMKTFDSSEKLYFVIYPESIYHNSQKREITVFCDIWGDTLYTSVNFKFKPYYSTTKQSAPYVKILGAVGGVS